MIRLEDVSVMDLTHSAYGWPKTEIQDKPIIEFLRRHNITNYKELESVLDSILRNDITPDFDLTMFLSLKKQLETTRSKVFEASSKDENPPKIFTFNTPQIFDIDDETIHITDSNNKCSVLPYAHPYARGAVLNTLKYLSIEDAKKLLSKYYTSSNGKLENSITCKRNFGNNRASKIAELIKLYDEQVVRQKASHKEANNCNLFTLNQNYKIAILADQLRDIVEYLFDTTDECIFGELNTTSKNKLASAAISTRGEENERTRTNLISILANYTTLEELEKGILLPQEVIRVENGILIKEVAKPIDRFVKVRKPNH